MFTRTLLPCSKVASARIRNTVPFQEVWDGLRIGSAHPLSRSQPLPQELDLRLQGAYSLLILLLRLFAKLHDAWGLDYSLMSTIP